MDKKEEIIREIRRVAREIESKPLTSELFQRMSRIPVSRIRYYFGSWNKAVGAAGLLPNPPGLRVSGYSLLNENDLLMAIGDLWRQTGQRPTEALMNSEGAYSVKPYRARWGSFGKAVDEYVQQHGIPEANIIQNDPKSHAPANPLKSKLRPAVLPTIHKPVASTSRKSLIFGEPIDFRGLRYAPVNEQGVVYLFGMISRELGFLIESIRTDYPDCEGKRALDDAGTKWQHVRIEFEYRSRNFAEHGHNPENCDLIVCWMHDWPECSVEVLELKSNMNSLPET